MSFKKQFRAECDGCGIYRYVDAITFGELCTALERLGWSSDPRTEADLCVRCTEVCALKARTPAPRTT